MSGDSIKRRTLLAGATLAGATGAMSRGLQARGAALPTGPVLPHGPVTITILDVGGALQITREAIEAYQVAKPGVVSRFVFNQAPAPEMAGKLRAQQSAGRVDIDLVLTGSDGLAAGLVQGAWTRLLPDHADSFPALDENYETPARNLLHAQGQGYGIVISYYPSGPLLEYLPGRVDAPPETAAALLAWAQAHPGRFMYARPANSGPGRTFLMGLPYLLGDRDPMDPAAGWDKTWGYLEALNPAIEYYATGTAATMKELGDGSRDIVVSTTGWDINPRALGIVPKEARIATLRGFHWVSDSFFAAVPAGIPDDRRAVVLDLIAFLLLPKQQALTYDSGYLYPGPAVKDVPLSLAPARSQQIIAEYGRAEYAALIATTPIELPLPPEKLVLALDRWDRQIGARK